jgi:hypothetical protein
MRAGIVDGSPACSSEKNTTIFQVSYGANLGATTLSITTLSITTLSITTLSITTLSTKYNKSLSINGFFGTVRKNDTWHK